MVLGVSRNKISGRIRWLGPWSLESTDYRGLKSLSKKRGG